jgi:sugar lactone lactonase YvrE
MRLCTSTCFRWAAALVTIVALVASPNAAAQSTIDASALLMREGVDEHGNLQLRIDAAAHQSLRQAAGKVQMQVPLNEVESVRVHLKRFEVIAPDARFIRAQRGGMAVAGAPQVVLLRGEIANEPASRVFLALTAGGGGIGAVQRGSGAQFHLGTRWINNQPAGLLVKPGAGDVPDFSEFCSVIPAPDFSPNDADGAQSLEQRGPRVLNIAIDADQAYCNLFGDLAAAEEYIVQALGAVSDIYMRDLNMKLVLRFSRLWPDGGEPFSATNLGGFREYWINNEDLTGLNLVHLMSGRRDTGYGGIAYLTNGCSSFGFAISAFLLGSFPTPNGPPHLGNWDVIVIAHEMGHNLSSPHTHSYDEPIDFCTSGVEQRGTVMSYCHTNQGGLLNIDLRMHTTVADFIASNNPPESCLWHDCNGNAIDDQFDIMLGSSADANGNSIPDECEDCNGNSMLDAIEIALGAPDVNANGILDSCENDCNGNTIPDAWEISQGAQEDLNGDNIPDSCQPDCDNNGIADFQDIFLGTHTDIDRDSVPDLCQDCNSNSVVDWIDMDRQFNIYISQTSDSLREYHRASGVRIADIGAGLVGAAYDIAFGPDRQLYIASFDQGNIIRLNVDSGKATNFVAPGTGGLNGPSSLTFGPDGNMYVASQNTSAILKFNGATGAAMGTFIASGSGGLASPWDIAFGPNGNLFVISGGTRVLQYHGSTGAVIGVFINSPAGTLIDARGMAFLPNGHLLITDRGNDRINRYSAAGALLGQFNDVYPLPLPWSIAIGPNGNVFAAQTTSGIRVIEYDVNTGRYLRSYVRGDSELNSPTAIAFRAASPNDANGNNILDSCEAPPCLGDIAPALTGDGFVNVQDLLAVISGWGACASPCPPNCAADVNHDCAVNVQDLLAVINNWGPCE